MNSKKILSLILAGVLALALAVPAFADGLIDDTYKVTDGSKAVTFNGSTKTPTVNIYLNSAAQTLVLNPYQLPYDGTGIGLTNNETGQIISAPMFIGSTSDVPVNIGVNAKVTKAGGVVISSKDLSTDTKTVTKSVFLFMEMLEATNGTTVPNFTKAYDSTAAKSGNQVVFSEAGTDRTKVATLKAAASTSAPTFVAYQIFGNAIKSPETAWATADTVTPVITFTFTADAVSTT